MRHDPGLAARPPLPDILKVESIECSPSRASRGQGSLHMPARPSPAEYERHRAIECWSMSTIASKLTIGILVSTLALGSAGVQTSIARAEEDSAAAAVARAEERVRAAARWDAAVESAREATALFVEPVRGAAASVGDLATAGDTAELDAAIDALDTATAGRDIGAIAARRNDVIAALAVFRRAVAASAEAVLVATPSADAIVKGELTAAIENARAIVVDQDDLPAVLSQLRSAADQVIASQQAAAAAAAADAAAAAAGADAAARSAAEGETGFVGQSPASPGAAFEWHPTYQTGLTIDAWGDYRPGCEVVFGEWDWWYYDSSGYVSIDPGYPYDIE